MEAGIKKKEKEFYLTIGDNESVDRVYHAVLKDHPEFFWMHNRNQVIKTTYGEGDYCMFSPSYSYTETETQQILQAMSQACQQLDALIPQGADDYVKAQMAYTYLIDTASYQESEDDQSIAGVFWKKQAVCAGYAGAAQYLLDHLGVYCIYVDGDTKNSDQGHAWNIIKLEESIIIWMPPMVISRNFWKGMLCSWQSIRPRSMIIFVLFRMNMNRPTHHRQNLRCLPARLLPRTFMC